jgi:hypothetical protein
MALGTIHNKPLKAVLTGWGYHTLPTPPKTFDRGKKSLRQNAFGSPETFSRKGFWSPKAQFGGGFGPHKSLDIKGKII